MALIETFEERPFITLPVKDLMVEVMVSANTKLQLEDNWFTQNNKQLFNVCGISPVIVEYVRANPDNVPLVVVFRPIEETVGDEYTLVRISKGLIVTDYDESLNLQDRDDITTKPILYPAYEAFMEALVQHEAVMEADWQQVKHTRTVIPGWQPADSQSELYIDAIEFSNLQFKLYKE